MKSAIEKAKSSSRDIDMCQPGFEGPTCQGEIDYCASRPCQNDGICLKKVSGFYRCRCLPGFTGRNCETDINECASVPCRNGGSCIQGAPNHYTCICPAGLTGKSCEIDIDECASHPCRNASDISECDSSPCLNNGTCFEIEPGSFQCHCAEGFTGNFCFEEINECQSQPCQNGGYCLEGKPGTFTCKCQNGFYGDRCQQEEVCHNKCWNGGRCEELDAFRYRCHCQSGFTGHNCEQNINECLSNPCKHRGICIDQINGYICKCMKGTGGRFCEINFDNCNPNRCYAGARCTDWIDDFYCHCPDYLTGKICNETKPGRKFLNCDENFCFNDGICLIDENQRQFCACPKGFEGTNCQTDIMECTPNRCYGNAKCTDWIDDFYCHCPLWSVGKLCDNVTVTTPGGQSGRYVRGTASTSIDGTTLAILLSLLYGIILLIILIALYGQGKRKGPRDFCFEIPFNRYYHIMT
ncbi:Fibropellin-1,Neurogenic locus notch homolog protein 1,Delta and Notch-like epidermal growth factor-related receptor,Sushi, von Willebrand factor type A, EGF and pentraxin domain-containing protein 1,Fibropellin-3 [Acanthosepion pharaonis]|uniref:EGF-like domain-containing protein n=1 Tax=Acanthosepion pharaonis TaxID=158019 RepID=A0A812C540_ACAPH|nr:Fibropellin-1,Neurogenic locus notch homolog protein 1,Delta and Notch-like epidermal growth factor-related receptor,Sushi, von Willebrand factor type A, EGF and pentraxin domain-containing protein 1,Fibropellin-3 [Sepia pharaonis]